MNCDVGEATEGLENEANGGGGGDGDDDGGGDDDDDDDIWLKLAELDQISFLTLNQQKNYDYGKYIVRIPIKIIKYHLNNCCLTSIEPNLTSKWFKLAYKIEIVHIYYAVFVKLIGNNTE